MAKKKKKAVKRGRKKAEPAEPGPATPVPASVPRQPAAAPPEPSLELYGLPQVRGDPGTGVVPGLDNLRMFFADRARVLRNAGEPVPTALVTDLDGVLTFLQVQDTQQVVHWDTRAMLVVRHWREFADEQRRRVHRRLKVLGAELDPQARQAIIEEKGKVTEAQVQAWILRNTNYQKQIEIEDKWLSLVSQIDNIIESSRTEVLVQDSVWTQRATGTHPDQRGQEM